MISVHLNNQLVDVAANTSLHEFLLNQHYKDQHFAVAINDQFVPRSTYQNHVLKTDDRIEIIVPMQGG